MCTRPNVCDIDLELTDDSELPDRTSDSDPSGGSSSRCADMGDRRSSRGDHECRYTFDTPVLVMHLFGTCHRQCVT